MDFFITAFLQGLGFAGLGLGIYISMKIFNIPDITTDGTYTLAAAVTAVLLMQNVSPFIVLPLAMLAGAGAGVITGFIHTKLNVNALLAGILTMTALYSINLAIMGRSNIPLLKVQNIFSSFKNMFTKEQAVIIILIFITILIWLLVTWLLKTDFGIAMRATGDSESMATAQGVNTTKMKIIGLGIANALTAVSGFLVTQYQGFADINMGIGIVISGLAAVMIAESVEKLFKHDKIIFQLLAVIIGTILFRLILAAALALGVNPIYLKLITAVIVLAVVSMTYFRNRNRA